MKVVSPKIEEIYEDQSFPYGKDFVKRDVGDTYETIYNKGYLPISVKESFNDGPIFDLNRSIRIDLGKFELSSENRRVQRKTEFVKSRIFKAPWDSGSSIVFDYDAIKVGKFCYENFKKRFPEKPMHISRIKRIFTGKIFNLFFVYTDALKNKVIGYAALLSRENILHYAYPFYDQEYFRQNLGIGMMLQAVIWAKNNQKKYIYLGTCNKPAAFYKLQFKGLEWFDGSKWSHDISKLKEIISNRK
jgi:leucyl-tRNA---protein transferase